MSMIGMSELIILIVIGVLLWLLIRAIQRRSRPSDRTNAVAAPTPLVEVDQEAQEQTIPLPLRTAPQSTSHVNIELQPEERRLNVATEVVRVPRGVTIKVSRSRTVEHSVAVDWRHEIGAEVGFQQFVTAAIRGEIERRLGRTYQQTETTAYEVELNGKISEQYKLTWVDVLLTGVSEVVDGGSVRRLPFEFRDRSELEITSISKTKPAAG